MNEWLDPCRSFHCGASAFLSRKSPALWSLFLSTVLFVTSCSVASTTPEDSSETSAPPPTLAPTDTQPLPTPSPNGEQLGIATPSSDAPILPEGSAFLSEDEYIVDFKIEQPDIKTGNTLLLVADEEFIGPPGTITTLDYLNWDGSRGPILSMASRNFEGLENLRLSAFPNTGNSPWILLNLEDSSNWYEFYAINISNGDIWALEHGCESFVRASLSEDYFAYSCYEDVAVWYFVSLSDPTHVIMRSLSSATEEPFDSAPPSIEAGLATFFPYLSDQVCAGNVHDWDPHCLILPFWLGPMSPDGSLFEVRTGLDFAPDEVGIIDSECILKQEVSCDPILIAPPPDFAPISTASRSLGDSVWLPNNEGLLYMVHIDTDRTNQSPEESELWMYRLADQSFHRRYELPGVQYFGDPWFGVEEPGYWSPDGGSIAISDWDTFSLLNIPTGDLTPLTEGGVLLGTITLP